MKGKPILCLDFDGVIHGYQSGWQGMGVCNDPPVPGTKEFLREAHPQRAPVLHVNTREGCIAASINDWIVRGTRDEIYPCKPDIFEATYDAVGETVEDHIDKGNFEAATRASIRPDVEYHPEHAVTIGGAAADGYSFTVDTLGDSDGDDGA